MAERFETMGRRAAGERRRRLRLDDKFVTEAVA